jgi:soluble lytic murein transglycosylase-like protein
MDQMTLVVIGALVLTPVASAHAEADPWRDSIAEASRRFDVPEPWIRAVMRAESGGRAMLDGRPITSRAGAVGLMQVMPATYAEMRAAHSLGPDPADPHDNILAGTAYLRAMFDRYGYPGLFAAYNAGPGRYEQSLRGRPLPDETRAYLTTVADSRPQPPSGMRLFITLRTTGAGASAAPPGTLFVPLTTVPSSRK